jgi:hypothetical protein
MLSFDLAEFDLVALLTWLSNDMGPRVPLVI